MAPLPFEPAITSVLGVVGGALFWLERHRPLRRRTQPTRDRVATNGALAVVATVVLRGALVPVVLAVAGWVERDAIGLMPNVPLPGAASALLAVVLLDYTTYLWHRLNHVAPVLWRFHRVHHTDLDLDVSTAFRFHFGELLLSVGMRVLQIALIGVGPVLALCWEAAELVATMLHHANLRLPLGLERALNRVLVTPRMHGIHHSYVEGETSSNWSVMFSWWDRAHGTARLNVPQDAITIGLPAFRDPAELRLLPLLKLPFVAQRPTWILPSGGRPGRIVHADPRRLAG